MSHSHHHICPSIVTKSWNQLSLLDNQVLMFNIRELSLDPCTANWDKRVKNCQNVHFFFAFLTSGSGKLHSFNPFFYDFLSVNQQKHRARCRTLSAWALAGHTMMIASGVWPVTWTERYRRSTRIRRGLSSGYRYLLTRSRIEQRVSSMSFS